MMISKWVVSAHNSTPLDFAENGHLYGKIWLKKNENLAQNITDKGFKYVHEDVLCYNTFHLFYQEKIGYWDFPVHGEFFLSVRR